MQYIFDYILNCSFLLWLSYKDQNLLGNINAYIKALEDLDSKSKIFIALETNSLPINIVAYNFRSARRRVLLSIFNTPTFIKS